MNSRVSASCASSELDDLDRIAVVDWAGHRAAVSYTFDDSNSSQLNHYERLASLGVPFSFYLLTDKDESKSPIWARALRDGHELGNHSKSHRKSGADIGADVDQATTFIENHFGASVWTMAAPYGSTSYCEVAQSRFLINRGVKDGLILPLDETNRFDLSCYVPPDGAPRSAYDEKVDAARIAGGWQVFLVHGFAGGNDDAYQPVALEDFLLSVQATKSHQDVWIGTVAEIGAYWLGQKAFTAARVLERGKSVCYAWELPSHFPPGKTLLAEASGTLSQRGKPLERGSTGYYELDLDARALTLTRH